MTGAPGDTGGVETPPPQSGEGGTGTSRPAGRAEAPRAWLVESEERALGVSQRMAVEPPLPAAGPRPFRAPNLVALGLAAALPAAVGGVLTVTGQAVIAAALAKSVTGLVLLGLVVVLNALLRKEGLGGEGFTGAAGTLGAMLVALSGAAAVLESLQPGTALESSDPGRALLQPLGRAGWLLLALWLGRSGWSLRKLVWPSGLVGWASLASAVALAGLALGELVLHVRGNVDLDEGSLALLPLALWSMGVAAVSCFGRIVTPEAPSD